MFYKDTLLISTTNKGKILEITTLLRADRLFEGVKLISLSDLGFCEIPEENGATFEENAIIKAQFYKKHTGHDVICDDSGFCVDILNGEPGVYSARWADNGDFGVAINKIYTKIEKLGVRGVDFGAYFECALAITLNDKIVTSAGQVFGKLATKPAGFDGFGYDPVFIPNGCTQTFAEMGVVKKGKMCHRSAAFKNLITKIHNIDDL